MAIIKGVNIEGQRIILAHVIGYVKVNSKMLRFDTHGGIDDSGDEAGIYVEFPTNKKLQDCLSYLDFNLGITEL